MLGRKEMVRRTEPGGLIPWTPFRELERFRSTMDQALEDFFTTNIPELPLERGWLPAVDVEEREKEYIFSVEVPGMEKEDVHVEVQNQTLKVSGERKEEKDEKRKGYLRHEQSYGAFSRAFTLPDDASSEGLKATCKNGVLKIAVPRSEKAKGKTVPITVS